MRGLNKNFKILRVSLYLWMVKHCDSPSVSALVINTDARDKLAASGLVEDDFVTIRDRPDALCGDFVSMNLVLESDIAAVDANSFIMTHTTNPLISSLTVERAVSTYVENLASHDSLFSVTKHQSRFFDSALNPINHDPKQLLRTQDLPVMYEENSCIYVFSRESFSKRLDRIGESAFGFESS